MTRRPCQNHSPAFKSKIALTAARGEQTLGELSQQFYVHANQIKQWRDRLLKGASDVFDPGKKSPPSTPGVNIKTLHAKIGELTLENDFLEGAFTKAGLLSAKRQSIVLTNCPLPGKPKLLGSAGAASTLFPVL